MRSLELDIRHDARGDTCEPRRTWLQAIALGLALGARTSHAIARRSGAGSDEHLLPQASGRVLRIRNNDPRLLFAATARAARDGDTTEIESDDHLDDVSSWPQSDLTIRGIGQRPRLLADGKDAASGDIEASRRELSNPDPDYRPREASRLVSQAGFRGDDASNVMLPLREYTHPASSCPVRNLTPLTPLTPGTFQTIAR
jgi:hypothetical protein